MNSICNNAPETLIGKPDKIVFFEKGFVGEVLQTYSIKTTGMYINIKLITKIKRVNCSQNPLKETKD